MNPPAHLASPTAQVWACVVCHRPDVSVLASLVAALEPQVARILVIDNSPGNPPLGSDVLGTAVHVPMASNRGTAGAMNEAWRLALAARVDYMVSFDQDSVPSPDLVACLVTAFATSMTQHVAAVGPAWRDVRTGRPMRLLAPVRFLRRHVLAVEDEMIEVDHVITSGCLISAEAYQAVGPFDEGLFLDYVDVEWSLRARARGFGTLVASACGMTHAIGENMIPLLGRQLAVHRPQRNYLQMRNHLLLWRMPWMPRLWLLSDMLQVAGKLSALLLLAPVRAQRLRCILQGAWDGLHGKRGPPD